MSEKKGIPSWQRATAPPPPATPSEEEPIQEQHLEIEPAPTPAPGAEEATAPDSQSDSAPLIEQASRFLEDPAIRDAPREKKVTFLESKGVGVEDIEKLLPSSTEDTSTDIDLSQIGESAWSNTPQQIAPPRPQSRDVPPIVTYPEFLVQSEKPPPLITARRLLNTAYITGGLAATMYGLSKYIVAPMAQSLAESRHDFASHAKEQLDEFNSRLGDIVSADPASKTKAQVSDVLDDISEADSDPTELFHRDFGTQTTPSLSRRPSVASAQDTELSTIASQGNRIKILTSHIKELEASKSNDAASSNSLKTKLSDLTTYLSEMSYQSHYGSGIGSFYGGNYGVAKSKDDQIETLKSDIRAVKGVLLSARNFPAGGPRTTGRAGA